MMERGLASVMLDQLDWDDRSFAVRSFGAPDSVLRESVRRFGVLSPPWVLERDGGEGVSGYAIVDGFQRLGLLREIGAREAECFVFREGCDPVRLLRMRIEMKLSVFPPNVAEKAQIVRLLSDAIPLAREAAECLQSFGIGVRPGALEQWRRLAVASDALLEAVASDHISERAAMELLDWEEDSGGEAVFLLRELRCSASIQMEILERVSEIALGRSVARGQVLLSPEVQEILHNPEWNRRRKTQLLRNYLYRSRNPRLRAREERFERELAAAGLPKSLHLAPPPFFEGEEWRLQATFGSPEELSALVDEAGAFARSPALAAIMRSGE